MVTVLPVSLRLEKGACTENLHIFCIVRLRSVLFFFIVSVLLCFTFAVCQLVGVVFALAGSSSRRRRRSRGRSISLQFIRHLRE